MTDILNKEDILLDGEKYLAQSKKIKSNYGHEAYLSALETSLENFEEYMTEFIIVDWAEESFEEGASTLNKLKRRRDIPPELKSKIEVRARYLEVLFRQGKGLRGYDGIFERYDKIPIRKRSRAKLKELIREIESLKGHELITKGAKNWAEGWYAEKKESRLKKKESRLKKERNRVVSDLMNRIDKAKNNKELEDLAREIGALQAQPEYVKEYKRLLDSLQTDIEKKYSSIYKGMRSLKKFFQRGRRASQIRTASKMLNELNKEISDLKEEL
jgi:hypothetical protein